MSENFDESVVYLMESKHLSNLNSHYYAFALNANSINRVPVLSVHNEDSNWNIDQIPRSLDVMSIFFKSYFERFS